MRRNLFPGILAIALLPAASVWAAPAPTASSAQYLDQINEQTLQIQIQADRLEGFVRSGALDAGYASRLTMAMAENTQKLSALLDAYVTQPGTVNDTRQQVERMKVSVAELGAFVGSAFQSIDSRSTALHADGILANVSNILDRGNTLRAAVHNLATAN